MAKGSKGLGVILRGAQDTLLALNVELEDDEAMRDEPVTISLLEPCAAE